MTILIFGLWIVITIVNKLRKLRIDLASIRVPADTPIRKYEKQLCPFVIHSKSFYKEMTPFSYNHGKIIAK